VCCVLRAAAALQVALTVETKVLNRACLNLGLAFAHSTLWLCGVPVFVFCTEYWHQL
jgi:hypothetical protein